MAGKNPNALFHVLDYYDWENHNMIEYVKARQGKQREFEASLRRLRGKNADVSEEAAEIQVCENSQVSSCFIFPKEYEYEDESVSLNRTI